MLVVSRKKNEGIVIRSKEGEIRVVLVEMERGRARLGIEAPLGCSIVREELMHEIKSANRLSAVEGIDGMNALMGDQGE
jgi:carbon storage regulator